MQFRHINPHNVRWLVPTWAMDPFALARSLEDAFARLEESPDRPKGRARLWAEANETAEGWVVRIAVPVVPEEERNCGRLFVQSSECVVNVPLWRLQKGNCRLDAGGRYTVYYHTFETECPLAYIGVTKRAWFERLAQHESDARRGSPYLFHRALREHVDKRHHHFVIADDLDYAEAMRLEEEFVGLGTLYPLGLNMIPGGFAGLRYLATLGVRARSAEERDAAVRDLAARENIEGRPNPLCAARWASDQDFVNRVVCGHSGRLSVEDVRRVRQLHAMGASARQIAGSIGRQSPQVVRVLRGSTYGRVA